VKLLASPVLEQGMDFVSPFYARHKYDATITNNIARTLTQSLYGKRLRQPIGGDFGLSPRLLQCLTREDVWETDIARFGIDIWMTTVAICEGFKICETFLGSKVHEPKDPAVHLGPMFRQVVGTLFGMMKKYENVWKNVRASEPVPLVGEVQAAEPEGVDVSVPKLIGRFREGHAHFGPVWREIVGPERFDELSILMRAGEEIVFPMDLWVHVVYDFATAYARWAGDRDQLLDMLIPVYFARIAGFVNDTRNLSTAQAEEIVDRQSLRFEELKPTLIKRWDGA
jgi:hypothetical protein